LWHAPVWLFCLQLLLFIGWQCLFSVSDYCSISDSSGCLRNWPMIPVEPGVLKYYNLELGWYLHLILKHPLGKSSDAQRLFPKFKSKIQIFSCLLVLLVYLHKAEARP
jgi:hypothetical protein